MVISVQEQLLALSMHSSEINEALAMLNENEEEQERHSSYGNGALAALGEDEDKQETAFELSGDI